MYTQSGIEVKCLLSLSPEATRQGWNLLTRGRATSANTPRSSRKTRGEKGLGGGRGAGRPGASPPGRAPWALSFLTSGAGQPQTGRRGCCQNHRGARKQVRMRRAASKVQLPAAPGPVKVLLRRRFSRVRLCATPQTAAHQAPPSMGISRQEYRSGEPLPSPNEDARGAHL